MQPELMKRCKDSQICSIYACRMTTPKISTFDGIKLYWKDCTSPKLQDSVQFQTVLALYDQKTVLNNGQTIYLRLKTSVKHHIDQMMRTRNFRVWNEVVERGSVTKSQKGKKAYVRRKVESVFSERHMDNVRKETHVVSVMTK